MAVLRSGLMRSIGMIFLAAALPALAAFGPAFFVTSVWNPVTDRFGALAPIYGTVVTSAIAMLIGIPVAFGIALFITELSPNRLKRPLATMIELLAAIPSIIYGIWGFFVLAPVVQEYVEPALIGVPLTAATLGSGPSTSLSLASTSRVALEASSVTVGASSTAVGGSEFTVTDAVELLLAVVASVDVVVPFLVSSRGYGIAINTSHRAYCALAHPTVPDVATFTVCANRLRASFFPNGSPLAWKPAGTTMAGTPIMFTQLVSLCGPLLICPSCGMVSSGGGICVAG